MITNTKNGKLQAQNILMLSSAFENKKPEELLAWALDRYGDRMAIVTSFQQAGMVIIDMATKINPKVRVATIDTGRLHEETYAFIQQVRERYGINVEVQFPDAREVNE